MLNVVCPISVDADGERTGLCVECNTWRPLDEDLATRGVCHECKQMLEENIWESTYDLLTTLVKVKRISDDTLSESLEILRGMKTVMGTYAAMDPREKRD